MTSSQIDALQIIINNDVIMSALQSVFSETLALSLPKIQDEDNTVIGEKYRAYNEASKIINQAFVSLAGYKKTSTMDTHSSRHI